ncbi:MAG: hypothetical protein ABI604_16165, partial [Nitrospirota bacterium]
RIQGYLLSKPGPLSGADSLFAGTGCHDRGGNVVTEAGKPLSRLAINRMITDSLRHSTLRLPC